jgi:hypothetical protein
MDAFSQPAIPEEPSFSSALVPLSRTERRLVWGVGLFVAATRLLAIARTAWDWDEILFCLGMRNYDIALHHPHPPGFPLFILIAKALRPLVSSEFRALQAIDLAASMLLFPAMFLFARELGFRFEPAVIAATLIAFFPNVWFYGGTAFSDVPAMVAVVAAGGFLLRGCRDTRAIIVGSALLAVAVSIRSQNLLVGAIPLAIGAWHQRRRPGVLAAAAVVAVAIVAGSYGWAIAETGSWERYRAAVETHRAYILATDSFLNPARPSLRILLFDFFLRQYAFLGLGYYISAFALVAVAISIYRMYSHVLILLLIFIPVCVVVWLMLDRYSVNRFSVGYAPLFACLSAEGMVMTAGFLWPQRRAAVASLLATIAVVASIAWTAEPLQIVRTTVAPSVAAAQWVQNEIVPRGSCLYTAHAMIPFRDYFFPAADSVDVLDGRTLPLDTPPAGAYLIGEKGDRGLAFLRHDGRLWKLARHHYFDVFIVPAPDAPQFGAGWFAPERSGHQMWRWMGPESALDLPPATAPALFELELQIPPELVARRMSIDVIFNEVRVDRFVVAERRPWKRYRIASPRSAGPNRLDLRASDAILDGNREVSLQMTSISWGEPE